MAGGLSCEECQVAYAEAGDDPPCEECGQVDLLAANSLAWDVWSILNRFDRPIQIGMEGAIYLHLPYITMRQAVQAHEGTERDLAKVMRIEQEMLPFIQEQRQKQAER